LGLDSRPRIRWTLENRPFQEIPISSFADKTFTAPAQPKR